MVIVQVQFGSVTFVQGHFKSYKITRVFIYNFLQKRDRALRMVSLCSVGHVASTDLHIDLLVNLLRSLGDKGHAA